MLWETKGAFFIFRLIPVEKCIVPLRKTGQKGEATAFLDMRLMCLS